MTFSEVNPLRDLIVVKRYERPAATPGGIIIPASWNTPTDCDTWEVMRGDVLTRDGCVVKVEVGAEVAAALGGFDLRKDDILSTFPFRGTESEPLTRWFGFEVFFLRAEEVRGVQRWKE